jgi:hypothetical protein
MEIFSRFDDALDNGMFYSLGLAGFVMLFL